MQPEPPRQVAPGTWWLGGCLQASTSSGPVHYHVSAYLVVGDDAAVLVDSGDPAHVDAVLRDVATVLGDRRLDYIFPTHPEIPHAGNVPALLAAYPEARVVGDVRDYHLHWPYLGDRLGALAPGQSLPLGGRSLEVLPAPIRDLRNTLWAVDTGARMMFVSDGFAFVHERPAGVEDDEPVHRAGQCRLTSSEMQGAMTVEAAAYGAGRSLYWSRFVDIAEAFDVVEALIAEHRVALIGPAHGAVIDDVSEGLRVAIGAHRKVFNESSGAMASAQKEV